MHLVIYYVKEIAHCLVIHLPYTWERVYSKTLSNNVLVVSTVLRFVAKHKVKEKHLEPLRLLGKL